MMNKVKQIIKTRKSKSYIVQMNRDNKFQNKVKIHNPIKHEIIIPNSFIGQTNKKQGMPK